MEESSSALLFAASCAFFCGFLGESTVLSNVSVLPRASAFCFISSDPGLDTGVSEGRLITTAGQDPTSNLGLDRTGTDDDK